MQTIQRNYPKIITTYEEQTCPALKIEKKATKVLPKISIIIRKSGSTTINICVSKKATKKIMIYIIVGFIMGLIKLDDEIIGAFQAAL